MIPQSKHEEVVDELMAVICVIQLYLDMWVRSNHTILRWGLCIYKAERTYDIKYIIGTGGVIINSPQPKF